MEYNDINIELEYEGSGDYTVPVVGVQFKNAGKIYYFSPNDLELKMGDGVVVETVKGPEFATVATNIIEMEGSKLTLPLKSVLRIATPEDYEALKRNQAKIKDSLIKCDEKIKLLNLDMNLIDCDIALDGSYITFYFTTSDDNKVDFRELLREIVPIFKTRIELRQIKSRAKAKSIGGLGICGREVCCTTFLSKCEPVSIKMAKDQNIALSPTKISGVCGKLMCCLRYEQECYEKMRAKMPRIQSNIGTPDGIGTVLENNVLTEKSRVKVQLNDGTYDVREYHISELQYTVEAHTCCRDILDDISIDDEEFE
jgi:cell fate regulator YaaT (PSP1 superfamily)